MKNEFDQTGCSGLAQPRSYTFCEGPLFLICLLALCASFIHPAFAEDTNAVIPYEKVDELCQIVNGIDQTKLMVRVSVGARNVRPTEIRLNIQSATKGIIPVSLSTNGEILNFPHQKELVRENPSILSNQPKGTMSLNVAMKIPVPEDKLNFPYARLGDGIAEANKAIRSQAGMILSLFAPKAQGAVFWFPKQSAGKAKVTIVSSSGSKDFVADGKGQVKVPMDKAWLAENPEVRLSEKVMGVIPQIE